MLHIRKWWIVTGFNLRETSWDFEELACYLNIESFFLYFYFFRVAFSVYLKCYFRGEWFLLLTCFSVHIYINVCYWAVMSLTVKALLSTTCCSERHPICFHYRWRHSQTGIWFSVCIRCVGTGVTESEGKWKDSAASSDRQNFFLFMCSLCLRSS